MMITMEKPIPVFVLLLLLVLVMMMTTTTRIGVAFGYSIAGCDNDPNNTLRFHEKAWAPKLTCSGITDKKMFWALTRPDGSEVNIAKCMWPRRSCRVKNGELYSVRRKAFGTSVLYMHKDLRTSIAGRVRCGGQRQGKRVDGAACKVHVYTPAFANTCGTGYSTYNWTMSRWCGIRKAYTSDGEYKCLWNNSGEQVIQDYDSMTNVTVEDGDFVSGQCVLADYPMPTVEGNYTYSLTILPRRNVSEIDTSSFLRIYPPASAPTLSCCPNIIEAGSDVTCSCVSSDSYPYADVIWSNGGEWGIRTLDLKNISLSMNGESFTCTQYWGGFARGQKRTVTYVLRVIPALSTSVITNITTTTITNITTTTTNEDDDRYLDYASLAVGVIGGITGGILGSVIALLIKDCIASRRETAIQSEEPVYSLPWSVDSKVFLAMSPTEQNPCHKDEEPASPPMQEV